MDFLSEPFEISILGDAITQALQGACLPGTEPVYHHVRSIAYSALAQATGNAVIGEDPPSMTRFIHNLENGRFIHNPENTGNNLPWTIDQFSEICSLFATFLRDRTKACAEMGGTNLALAYLEAARTFLEDVSEVMGIPDISPIRRDVEKYRRLR